MSFPRLSNSGDQELARLLKAGRTDVPSSASKQRALAAALVGATAGSSATFAIKASLMTTPVRAWLLVGMITVGIPTALLVHQVRGASLPIATPTTTPAPTSVSVATAAVTAIESVEMPPVPTAEAPKVALAPSSSPHTSRATPTAKAGKAAPSDTSLSRELAVVRRVNSALATDGHAALALLDAYAAQFPNPRFDEEAVVLRIEALVMVGETTLARAAAATFATEFPRSAYGARVASALSRAE